MIRVILSGMTWTSADLEAIDQAIATGELSVRQGDRTVTYRSMDELLSARRTMLTEMSAKRSRFSYSLADFSSE